ncbi:PRMT5 [Symbiodinium natans]|uniref:PRMT5 protein n=1 Tax=Symbiodinium natans TaxID=878477 RepID=A0A812GQ47_9DINO|nr:PRMT5 [Symbiodinium natans]
MAKVSCALRAFEVPPSMLQTSRQVAAEFVSRLDPSLVDIGCGIEVYRLHKLHGDENVSEGDQLLCSLPAWHFDMDALEHMFSELEELRAKHAELGWNFEKAEANLVSYGPAVQSDATVQQMRQHLAQRDAQIAVEKQTQQKLRADLLAIREQSEHLMQLVLEEAVGGNSRQATASHGQNDPGVFSAGSQHSVATGPGQRFIGTASPRPGAMWPRYGQGFPRTHGNPRRH